MVMTTTESWDEALRKGTVPLVVHVLIEGAKHKTSGAEIDVEWVSAPSMQQASETTAGLGNRADPVISGITSLSSSLDPMDRKIQIGEVTVTILDSNSVRGLFDDFDVVGKSIFIKVGTPEISLESDFLPYWAGLVFDIIPQGGTTIDIVCKTRLRKLAEKTWKGQIANKNKLEAVEAILTEIGFTSSDYDAASFDKSAAANSDLIHFVDSSLNFNEYHHWRNHDAPMTGTYIRYGGSYPTAATDRKVVGKKWPGPDSPGVRSIDIIGDLLFSTYGCLSTDSASGKIKFIPWNKSKDVSRTLDAEDYRDFVVTEVFGETLVNSIRIPLSYKDAVQDFVYRDTDSITRYDREVTLDRDLSFNIYLAAAAKGPGPQQFSAADKALGAWTDTENTEEEFQDYFGSDDDTPRATLDRAYPHAIELGGYQVTGFAGTDRMDQPFDRSSAATFSGELSPTTPGYYWIPDFNVVYKCTNGPVLNILKNGEPGMSATAMYSRWDENGDPVYITVDTNNAVIEDYKAAGDSFTFGSLRLPFFEIDTTSNEPWLPENQVWDSAVGPSGSGYYVGGTQSLFIDQLGTTFKPLATNQESSIATENNTWVDNHNNNMADIEYSAAEEIEVYDITQAEYYSRQVLERSSNGMPTIEFSTGLGHMDLELGDFLAVKNTGVFLWRGIPCEDCKFEITKKTVDLYAGEVLFTCVFASISPVVYPATYDVFVKRFGLGDSNFQSYLNWENLQRLAGIDFGLKPSLLPPKSGDPKFPFIGPGRVSGGRGGPKTLKAGSYLTSFPPPDFKAGVKQYVYYGVDTRTGQIISLCVDYDDDSHGFMANTQKIIPIMRVVKTTADELDESSLEDLRETGGYSNPGNQIPSSQSELRLSPKNGDITTWGDSRSLPDGWGATTLNGYPLNLWNEDPDLTNEVGPNPPTAPDMQSSFFEKNIRLKTGKHSIQLNSISASNTYTVGGSTRKLIPYQWKVFTPPFKGLEIGGNYSFSLEVRSTSSGNSFGFSLEYQNEDGSWALFGSKEMDLDIAAPNTWEIFTLDFPGASVPSVRGAISFTGYGENDLIIDSFKVQNLDLNPRTILQLNDVSAATANNAILRWKSTPGEAEWSPYGDYVFRAEGENYPTTVGTGSTVELLWEAAEINTHGTYYDPTRGTLATFPDEGGGVYRKWYCPASGYWRVRARIESASITSETLLGDNPTSYVRMKMGAYKYSYAGVLDSTIGWTRVQVFGSPEYSYDGTNSGVFVFESITHISQSENVLISVENSDASNTYTLSDANAYFEITPVLIE